VRRAFELTRTTWDPQELMPRDLLDQAERAFAWLLVHGGETVVLHGDLHHANILWDATAGWLVIDPKGAVGPRALEVGRYIQNRLPLAASPDRWRPLVRERVEIFAAVLGHSRQTVLASALVDVVLSHCWGFEDETLGADWHHGILLGRYLAERLAG
jgi:streptomycin 6-kinase